MALENLPPGCFRVSSLDSASGRIATWLMAHRSSVEVEYDVNLLRVSPPLSSSDDRLFGPERGVSMDPGAGVSAG